MPEPLRGLVAIAEYGSKLEVDLAVAALIESGFLATASYDPAANSPATYFASDRTFELLVREEEAADAVARLYELDDELPEEFRTTGRAGRSPKRARLRRIVIAGIVLWFAIPLLLAAIVTLAR
jgi:hypothetical protein